MPTNFIDPNGAGVTDAWTKSSGTTAWAALDDGVRSPTSPRTSGDGVNITSSTATQVSEVSFPDTLAFDAAEILTLFVFGSGGTKRRLDVQVSNDDGVTWRNGAGTLNATDTAVIAASAAAAWATLVISGAFASQANLNGLRVRLICSSTGSSSATAVQLDGLYIQQWVPVAETGFAKTGSGNSGGDVVLSAETGFATAGGVGAGVEDHAQIKTGGGTRTLLTVNTAPSTSILDSFIRADEDPLSAGGVWANATNSATHLKLAGDAVLETVT